MSILKKLATGRSKEPNKKLGQELAAQKDLAAIQEIAENLWNKDKKVQGSCISVLEEIGLTAPELITAYTADFLKLLASKNNRLVWGAMILLSLVAAKRPQEIFDQVDVVKKAMETGTVITLDKGIKTLAIVAEVNETYNKALFPYLIALLQTCRKSSVAQYAESMLYAVTAENQTQYMNVLNQRLDTLSSSQQKRVKKLLRMLKGQY